MLPRYLLLALRAGAAFSVVRQADGTYAATLRFPYGYEVGATAHAADDAVVQLGALLEREFAPMAVTLARRGVTTPLAA